MEVKERERRLSPSFYLSTDSLFLGHKMLHANRMSFLLISFHLESNRPSHDMTNLHGYLAKARSVWATVVFRAFITISHLFLYNAMNMQIET